MTELKCERCGEPATHHTIDGIDSKLICADYPGCNLMRRAAVAYVTREDGRMLVVWNKRYGGWTMPGGLVEEGETPGVACARELQEETGLVSFTYEHIYEAPTEPHFNDGRGTHCHVYRVKPRMFDAVGDNEHPRECELGCPVTWFTREEFLRWCPFAKFYEKMFAALESTT